jgi:hypothetical protein
MKQFSGELTWVLGPQVFLNREKPHYYTAFSVHLACYSCMAGVIIFLRFYLIRQNRKKDEMVNVAGLDAADPNLVHAFDDKTDKENMSFRYMY